MLLQRFVATALLAASACAEDAPVKSFECFLHLDRTLKPAAMPGNDPPLRMQIESCRVDVDACDSLCNLAMKRAVSGAITEHCAVTFEGGNVIMQIAYEIPNPDAVCEGD